MLQVTPPVVIRPDRLPLLDSQLSWNSFEGFVRQLIRLQPGTKNVKRYGKAGSKQKGIDLIATREDGTCWVFQCKQWTTFKLADAKKAVLKTTYPADKYFLVIACQTDSTVHDYVDALDKWELWDVERVSDEVLRLPTEPSRDLVQRYFSADWCKVFLGIGPSSPFLPWKSFYARWLRKDRLFNHTWHLVGRTEFLSSLHEFCSQQKKRVALLTGRGGIGKSKLLHAFAQTFSAKHPKNVLWFLEEGIPLTQQSIDELPAKPCVIVIDDAHRSANLGPLLTAAVRPNSQIRLLLSTRPQRLEFLRAELTRAGLDYTQIEELQELKQLKRDDVKALARQALGPRFAAFDRQLAAVTWDCPLVTVVGGKLLADEAIDPRLLASHDGFRAEVLQRFQDIIVGRIGNDQEQGFYSNLLQVLSATAPFPLQQQEFLKAVADFLGRTSEDVINGIGELERNGVLLRRGKHLRITPDVLGDHILHRACIAVNLQPTGYADRVFEKFATVHPEKVFLNLAELDWRVQNRAPNLRLLPEIWKRLEETLATGSPKVQAWVIGLVKAVAYYQPERALRMVGLAVNYLPAPSIPKPGISKGLGGLTY